MHKRAYMRAREGEQMWGQAPTPPAFSMMACALAGRRQPAHTPISPVSLDRSTSMKNPAAPIYLKGVPESEIPSPSFASIF